MLENGGGLGKEMPSGLGQRDTGSQEAKASIQGMLDKFLADTDSENATPVEVSAPSKMMTDPGPVAPYVPVGNEPKKPKSLSSLTR